MPSELQSTEIKVKKYSTDEYTAPNYDWTSITNWIWTASKSGKEWRVLFTLPQVASFDLGKEGVKITPIGDIKSDKFRVGNATNFDSSVVGIEWYKRKKSIPSVFGLLVRNCSRAVFADALDFGFNIKYKESLKEFGYEEGEHIFDPSSNVKDLEGWIEDAPSLIVGRGSYTAHIPELKKALQELSDMLPDELSIKVDILF